ncbi:MAG TPA: transposase [Phototrophicaceae bacterium]|nr:transposase [Phototrophicaceae bacterium]
MDQAQVTVELAYYPPYHSQYNPIERVWRVLEQHWNGRLLDSCQTMLRFAQTMTFRGRPPQVHWLRKIYYPGVRLTQQQMAQLEPRFERLPG